MNKETLVFCVQAAQKGDRQAMERLLMYIYGIVDYQCGKLLPTAQSAEKMTGIVLKTVVSKLKDLAKPEEFFAWLGRLTAVRCMRLRATLLENGTVADDRKPTGFSFPNMELNKGETAKVAEMLTDMLDPDQRLNLYLFSLGAMSPKAISGLTGVPEETVEAQIQQAQTEVLKQMKRYADQGVVFTQANSLPALLRTRMLTNPAPEKAQTVVRAILLGNGQLPQKAPARNQPVPPQAVPRQKQSSGLVRTLAIIAGILTVVLVISLAVLFTKLNGTDAFLMTPETGAAPLFAPLLGKG